MSAVGTLADVDKVLGSSPAIVTIVGFVMFLAIAIHLVLSWIFRIDVDTFIISSAAAIFGPPFIAPVAKAIRSPYIIPVGLALGVLGLAVGNYCGPWDITAPQVDIASNGPIETTLTSKLTQNTGLG